MRSTQHHSNGRRNEYRGEDTKRKLWDVCPKLEVQDNGSILLVCRRPKYKGGNSSHSTAKKFRKACIMGRYLHTRIKPHYIH